LEPEILCIVVRDSETIDPNDIIIGERTVECVPIFTKQKKEEYLKSLGCVFDLEQCASLITLTPQKHQAVIFRHAFD